VIVGDHERLASALCDFADARNPGSQLFGRVEIVVTLMRGDRCIVGEPRVVAPAVKPHISDGRRSLSRWRKRSPDDGLVDVAESGAAGVQQFQRFLENPTNRGELRRPKDSPRTVSIPPKGTQRIPKCDETKKGIAAGPRPSLFAARSTSKPARTARSSAAAEPDVVDLMSCVNRCQSLALKTKRGFAATRSIHGAAWSGRSGW